MRENGWVFLFAALVPPRAILDDLWSVVEVTPDPDLEKPPSGRSKAWRLLRRQKPEVAPPTPAVDLAPVAHVNLTLAKFGNLALAGRDAGAGDGPSLSGGHPDYVPQACDRSLKRLGVDHIDIYRPARLDPRVPYQLPAPRPMQPRARGNTSGPWVPSFVVVMRRA